MKYHPNGAGALISTLAFALALSGCGGGTSADTTDSGASMSALGTDVSASSATSTSTATDADTEEDSGVLDQALRYNRPHHTLSTATTATSTSTVATTTAAAAATAPVTATTVASTVATSTPTTSVATVTAPITTVTTTTAPQSTAGAASTTTTVAAAAPSTATPTAVTLSWATPVANATVKGTTTVVLTGQAFKNVEIFSAGIKIATATVSGNSTSATASIDTTQFANGALALTAHGWNSAAGTTFTSDADAGTLNVVVSNATTTAAVASTATATTAAPTATATTGTQIGVNLHLGGTNTTDNQTIANILGARHLTSARMEFNKDLDLTLFRDQMTRLKAAGVQPEINLQISYQWDYTCNQNFTAVESDAYNQTVVLVQRVDDMATDFELLNEVSLRPDATSQVTPSQAAPASAYAGKSCYSTLASVLRGMSRAIHDQASASGKPLRVILGAVGNDFPFLDYMQSQGVAFDVVGYHIYPSLVAPAVATDPFYGPGGPVGMLAKYGKPVRINEFNCGEIYLSTYDNLVGSASTATCMASIQKHLASLMKQTVVKLETVDAFVLLDDPKQSVAAERRFGLMYDLNTPKIHLAAFSLFAGGTVSAAEKVSLTADKVSGN